MVEGGIAPFFFGKSNTFFINIRKSFYTGERESMPNSNLVNAKNNMKSRIRTRVSGSNPRDLGRLAKSARFVGLTDDAEVETDIDTEMAAAIPSASVDDLVEMSEGLKELRTGAADMGSVANADNLTEGGNKFLNAASVQPQISVSGDLSYNGGVVSYTAPTASALQVVATVGDLPAGASAGDQAVVQSNNKLYIKTADGWYAVALINTAPSISGNDAAYTLATDQTPTVITLTATDPENDPVTFSYSVTAGTLNGTTVDQTDNVFTITPHGVLASSFELTFSANDSVNVATAVSSFSLVFIPEKDFTNMVANKFEMRNPHAVYGADDHWSHVILGKGTKFLAFGKKFGGGSNWVTMHSIPDLSAFTSPVIPDTWVKTNGESSKNGGISGASTENYPIVGMTEVNANSQMSETYYGVVIDRHSNSSKIRVYNVSDGQLVQEISYAKLNSRLSISGDSVFASTPTQGRDGQFEGGPVLEFSITTGNLLGTFDYPGNFQIPTNGQQMKWGWHFEASDTVVAVSAYRDFFDGVNSSDKRRQHGRVYLFDRTTRNFIAGVNDPEGSYLGNDPNDFGGSDGMWSCTAINGDYLVVGSPFYKDSNVGALHIFDISTPSNPTFLHTIDQTVYTSAVTNTRIGTGITTDGKYCSFADRSSGNWVIVNMETGSIEISGIDGTYGAAGALLSNSFVVGQFYNVTYQGRSGKVTIYPTE